MFASFRSPFPGIRYQGCVGAAAAVRAEGIVYSAVGTVGVWRPWSQSMRVALTCRLTPQSPEYYVSNMVEADICFRCTALIVGTKSLWGDEESGFWGRPLFPLAQKSTLRSCCLEVITRFCLPELRDAGFPERRCCEF